MALTGTGCPHGPSPILILLLLLPAVACLAADTRIRLNSLGFLPGQEKRASVAAQCSEFTVRRVSDGETVLRGRATGPIDNPDTKEKLWLADFSSLKDTGTYTLDVPGLGQSIPFRVGADVYDGALRTALKAMYLWRCGCAVEATYQGQTFGHAACHTKDAYLDYVGGGHQVRPSVGGWHDAGDYNKYVVNAGVTVGVMLMAWEQHNDRLRKLEGGLPESGNGIPDYLNELKWEMDWLLTMQAEDGSVYHKVSTLSFGGFIPANEELNDRFITPWSSAATADFVAMAAKASRAFQPYRSGYARQCLDAARKSYTFLQSHPENHSADLRGFSTGGYQTRDDDDRLWAAAELYEATGEEGYLKDFEARAHRYQPLVDPSFGWSNVKDLGMLTYLLSRRTGRDPELVSQVRASLLSAADGIVRTRNAHGYARPLGTTYFWGCNGDVAAQTVLLQAANRMRPNTDYVNTALDALGHLFGRNYHCRSYVTGLGYNPPMHPHDRSSGSDKAEAPWPGYLVGGGHPDGTSWRDEQGRYDLNEIAINWNAPLIYALAAFASR